MLLKQLLGPQDSAKFLNFYSTYHLNLLVLLVAYCPSQVLKRDTMRTGNFLSCWLLYS